MGKNIITNSVSKEKMKLVKNGAFDIDEREGMFLKPEKNSTWTLGNSDTCADVLSNLLPLQDAPSSSWIYTIF